MDELWYLSVTKTAVWIRGFCVLELPFIMQQDAVKQVRQPRHRQGRLLISWLTPSAYQYFQSPLVCVWLGTPTGHNRCLRHIIVCSSPRRVAKSSAWQHNDRKFKYAMNICIHEYFYKTFIMFIAQQKGNILFWEALKIYIFFIWQGY